MGQLLCSSICLLVSPLPQAPARTRWPAEEAWGARWPRAAAGASPGSRCFSRPQCWYLPWSLRVLGRVCAGGWGGQWEEEAGLAGRSLPVGLLLGGAGVSRPWALWLCRESCCALSLCKGTGCSDSEGGNAAPNPPRPAATCGGTKLVHMVVKEQTDFMSRVTPAALASASACLAEVPWGQETPGRLGLHQDAASGMRCGTWDLCSVEMARKPL